MTARIPVAHIHGGEATEGLIDEPIRHSITKMSHLHFTATDEYAKRVRQLGEHPDRIFMVGTPGLDNIEKLDLLSRVDFENAISFELGDKSAMVTFHPVTLENDTAREQFEELLDSLDEFKDLNLIFTMPNADTNGRIIIQMIDEFVKLNPNRTCAFISLGQLKYLSALQHVDIVIGNSSSGLIEAPSFKKPTVNIGDRQRGRVKAKTVIDCEPQKGSIISAIKKAFSSEMEEICSQVKNPYGTGGASKQIKEVLKSYELKDLIKKALLRSMRVLFIGSVDFSLRMLKTLSKISEAEIVGVATKSKSDFNSDHSDLSDFATSKEIPFKYVKDINASHIIDWMNQLRPEIIFCFGWSAIIKKRGFKHCSLRSDWISSCSSPIKSWSASDNLGPRTWLRNNGIYFF